MRQYQAYSEYRDSGVEWIGDIPIDWSIQKQKYVFNALESGVSVNAADISAEEHEVGVLKTSCVYTRQFRAEENKTVVPEELHRVDCPVVSGSIIISRMNTPDLVGAAAYVELEYNDLYLPDRLWQTTVRDEGRYHTKYFWYAMYLRGFRDQISNAAQGASSSMQNITQEDFLGICNCVPSLAEQQKIANFLDHETAKIDTLIEKQQQLIKLLKEKRQAVISHAVTKGLNPDAPMKDSGVEWLGEVPEHWVTTKLSNRFIVQLGKMLDDKKITGEFLGEYLRNTDVQWGSINTRNLPKMDFRSSERERFTVKTGDLLVCEGGEIGRCAIWTDVSECFYQKALHRLRPINSARDSSDFLYFVLFTSVHQGRFLSAAEKATIAHLPAEAFRQYIFVFPPYEEQLEIATHLKAKCDTFEQMENNIAIQNSLLKERRTALISAAVTGKIDVRNWQPPASGAERESSMEVS